jgi:hypothetical protein
MAHTGIVRLALRDLRVRGEQIVRGEVNDAYNTITYLGYTRGRADTAFEPQVSSVTSRGTWLGDPVAGWLLWRLGGRHRMRAAGWAASRARSGCSCLRRDR